MHTVGDYMKSQVMSIGAGCFAREIAMFMEEKKIGSIMVVDQGEYIGIVTDADITRKLVARGLDPTTTPVKEIMKTTLISIEEDEPVMKANKLMRDNNIRYLVVKKNHKIVGVLSIRDLLIYTLRMIELMGG